MLTLFGGTVPNAPCGVERGEFHSGYPPPLSVPNAPCGVESRPTSAYYALMLSLFLMHRVELKM